MVRVDAKNNVYMTISDDGKFAPKVYYADRSAIYEIQKNDILTMTITSKDKSKKKVFTTKGDTITIAKGQLDELGLGIFDYEVKLQVGADNSIHTIISTYDKKFNPHFYVCESLA